MGRLFRRRLLVEPAILEGIHKVVNCKIDHRAIVDAREMVFRDAEMLFHLSLVLSMLAVFLVPIQMNVAKSHNVSVGLRLGDCEAIGYSIARKIFWDVIGGIGIANSSPKGLR